MEEKHAGKYSIFTLNQIVGIASKTKLTVLQTKHTLFNDKTLCIVSSYP